MIESRLTSGVDLVVAQAGNERSDELVGGGDGLPNAHRRVCAGLERPHRGNAARSPVDARAEIAFADALPEHGPRRPAWDCRTCAGPWPCPAAREQLLRRIPRFQLGLIMNIRMAEAAADLPVAPPGSLWERFVAWTH